MKEEVHAKAKLGEADAWKMAQSASQVIAAKGKRVTRYDMTAMKADAPAKKELLSHMLGPTGNLRAPTIVCGKTVVVGFSDEVYEEVLG